VKRQPQWIQAVYNLLANKHSNVHLAVGVVFPDDRYPEVHTQGIFGHIADVWLVCKSHTRNTLG